MSEFQTLVIDNGSNEIKAGFGGEGMPKTILPSVVGKIMRKSFGKDNNFIGNEAINKREICNLTYPITNGLITNWDTMEKLWYHLFTNELKVAPENHPILLTEASLNSKLNRGNMAQIMFETFNASSIYFALPGLLALYGSGRTSGIVLDSGDGISHVIPIINGECYIKTIDKRDLAGKFLTDYLSLLLNKSYNTYDFAKNRELTKQIKESLCYVALDYNKDFKSPIIKTYKLPDGKIISIGTERITVPEVLFKKSFNEDYENVQEMINQSLKKFESKISNQLFSNIVLTGGNTLLTGFKERLEKELKKLNPKCDNLKIIAPPDRKYTAWIGGSIVGSLPKFSDSCITKKEYEENGSSIIKKKFPIY